MFKTLLFVLPLEETSTHVGRKSILWQLDKIARYYDRTFFKSGQIADRWDNLQDIFKSQAVSYPLLGGQIDFGPISSHSIYMKWQWNADSQTAIRSQVWKAIEITMAWAIWFISTQVTPRARMQLALSTLCVKLPAWKAICIRVGPGNFGGLAIKSTPQVVFCVICTYPMDSAVCVVICAFQSQAEKHGHLAGVQIAGPMSVGKEDCYQLPAESSAHTWWIGKFLRSRFQTNNLAANTHSVVWLSHHDRKARMCERANYREKQGIR